VLGLGDVIAPEVRLVAFDVAVVGCEIDAYVDHVVRCEWREDGQVIGGDIIDRRARDRLATPELRAVIVELRGPAVAGLRIS
jgi:hypothetical protein